LATVVIGVNTSSDEMANLKADLDNYLKSGSNKNSSSSLSNLANSFSLPTLKSPFSSSSSTNNFQDGDDLEVLIDSGGGGGGDQVQTKSRLRIWCESQVPTLSYKYRLIGFMTFLGLGLFCFSWSTLYLPVIILKARKFALLFSLGSAFVMGAFALLWGPWDHFQHLVSRDRLPFTATYLTSLALTLYFAMGLQSTPLTTVAAGAQIMALVWYVVSYLPGGQTGLKFMSRMCGRMCSSSARSSLPI